MLNAKNFGLAGGVVWGISMFLITLASSFTGYGKAFLEIIASVYPYYDISLFGSLIGLVIGFVDGFIGFFLIAWVYNFFENR